MEYIRRKTFHWGPRKEGLAMANLMNQPMYQRIKEDILHQIKTNLLSPGDRLPTEYQLMDHYQVSRITVSKALSELKSEGVIEPRPWPMRPSCRRSWPRALTICRKSPASCPRSRICSPCP